MVAESGEWVFMATGPGEDAAALTRLVKHAKAGDVTAFRQIVIQHQRQVLLTALRLLGRLESAQDAAQDVFLRLHKYLDRYDERRELSVWLHQITVNVCRDMNRQRRRTSALSLDELQESGALREMADSIDLEENLARSQQRRLVLEALNTLPEKEREALVLRDIEGLSTREVARILGSSESTVRSQISTARVKIKRFVERFLGRSSSGPAPRRRRE